MPLKKEYKFYILGGKKMKIAIAGTGYVGLVTGVCLAEVGNENVVCVDVDEQKVKSMKLGIAPIYEEGLEELMVKNYNRGRIDYTTDYKKAYEDVDVILIAVGTPERSDGSANLDYIKAVAKQIAETVTKDTLVVIKSTVPIGTNEEIEDYINRNLKNNVKVELASNPEFLSQGTAVKDTLYASRIVIGVESEWAREILEEIYKPFNQPIIVTNRNSAEMIKYASNNFLALKISFMNDIANLCEIAGANIEDVALGMSYDDRIGSKFLKAGIGYGGSCFPKDTKALHWLSEHNGYELKTVKAAIEVNESQKLKLVRKASKLVESFQDMKVAVLGLTFKPDTDDIREAPSIPNIKYLLERGARVTVYDPIGVNNTKKIFGDFILYADSVDDAIEDAEICFIMTEWKDVLNYDIHKYKEKMKNPLVLDGRNCYKVNDMEELGIEYYSIGR
ncbi:UDP-glucose/GDP-mannose dehydrogenase family protein [Clostridioides difficile]|nr:UDP-glucose/GDP-mannose dehydrogenase family protein [Clostridioides difficile]MBY2483247.1 UDP-glucose/GDP-mannose dehydrogenase family protein [Clostridioides difficile]MDM9959823.1 UDP-glucose/GDP-mannose dehydrogenase family protein [Clostridioides difficile]MDO0130502.1 UDP-glucose/GDP-mannose dehydrogenase family protein [Clostridioides difficile]HBG5739480.1 UDP-glucose/GDP-mannose dehydrogenase family protein [Clostridioides difficile]